MRGKKVGLECLILEIGVISVKDTWYSRQENNSEQDFHTVSMLPFTLCATISTGYVLYLWHDQNARRVSIFHQLWRTPETYELALDLVWV